MAQAQPVAARPASAVVLGRDRAGGGLEVFMVQRHVRSEFMPEVFVFPGGSVHSSDIETERTPGLCGPDDPGQTALGTGFRVAALRECFEEAGVLLARRDGRPLTLTQAEVERFQAYRDGLNAQRETLASIARGAGVTLATDELVHWAHWITPEAFPKRFDTHFFLAPMPEGQQAAHDQLETTASAWITPEDALDRAARGDFPLAFATIHQLQGLTGLASVEAALARFRDTPVTAIMPRVVRRDGQNVIVLPDEN